MSDIINTARTGKVPAAVMKRKGPAPRFAPMRYEPPKPKPAIVVPTFAEARENARKAALQASVWTPERCADMQRRIEQGACLVELGELYNARPDTVRAACWRLGIKAPPLRHERKKWQVLGDLKKRVIEMMDDGKSAGDIAAETGLEVRQVYQIRYHERKRRKKDEHCGNH